MVLWDWRLALQDYRNRVGLSGAVKYCFPATITQRYKYLTCERNAATTNFAVPVPIMPIKSGRYFITNVYFKNHAFLPNSNSAEPIQTRYKQNNPGEQARVHRPTFKS
jgi:hypothetical protein